MRFIYTLIIILFLPLALIRLYFLGFKNPDYRKRWLERVGVFNWSDKDKPVIWLHAVSVGETNAAAPLLTRLIQKFPNHQLLVTTVTPTGAKTLSMHFGNEIIHRYFPYDLPWVVNSFIDRLKPSALILMETEIWPNLCHVCEKEHIPVLLINARLSKKSFTRYIKVKTFIKETISKISLIAAQGKLDAERFIELGMPTDKVKIIGNLKFDVVIPRSVIEKAEVIKRSFNTSRPIWMAASTQEGEEEIIFESHKLVLQKYNNAILILAARHPERNDKIEGLCQRLGLNYTKRTDNDDISDNHQVYLLNTLGELQQFYAASQLAFVGGSLVNKGGQNMLEPAKLGIPVLSGPSRYNFAEVTDILLESGGLITISNAHDLANQVIRLFEDANLRHDIGEAGKNAVDRHQGNIEKTLSIIQPYLN